MKKVLRLGRFSVPVWVIVALMLTATAAAAGWLLFTVNFTGTVSSGEALKLNWEPVGYTGRGCEKLAGPGTASVAPAADGLTFTFAGVTPATSITCFRWAGNPNASTLTQQNIVVSVPWMTAVPQTGQSIAPGGFASVNLLVGFTEDLPELLSGEPVSISFDYVVAP